ncbi:MAG: hypothetical protein KF822_11410 [Steroidobacteraceae bacterium]|nr:hypothetical protein [Steroidobacteraceae bacterium]
MKGNVVVVNGNAIDVGMQVLDARMSGDIVLVLIDPDSYLLDPEYRRKRNAGMAAIRNLRAFTMNGSALWEAEMPEDADYYCKIVQASPIEMDSFSSFRCRIDARTGKIISTRFMK